MSERSIVAAASIATVGTASTAYYGTFGGNGALTVLNTTEAAAQVAFRGAGTLSKMRVLSNSNARASATTVTARKNGADTALTVSIGAGLTGTFSDLSNTVAYADGDLWNYAITTGTGGSAIRIGSITAELATATQAFTQLASFGSLSITSVRALGFAGSIVNTGAEATINSVALESATLSKMQVIASTNASAGYAVRLRKNGANGNQIVTIGSGLTGVFEDASNTDTIAAGDTYGAISTAPSAASIVNSVAVTYTGAVANRTTISAGSNATSLASAATRYSSIVGIALDGAAEANVQCAAPFAATLSHLSCNVRSNASAAGATMAMRVNGATVNQTVSITGSTTGLFQDLSNTDVVAAGDLLATIASGSNGNVDFSYIGMLVTADAEPDPPASNGSRLTMLGVG